MNRLIHYLRPSRRQLLLTTGATVVAGSAAVASYSFNTSSNKHDGQLKKINLQDLGLLARSSSRITSLLYTVALMTADYGFYVYILKKGSEATYKSQSNTLRRMEAEHDTHMMELLDIMNNSNRSNYDSRSSNSDGDDESSDSNSSSSDKSFIYKLLNVDRRDIIVRRLNASRKVIDKISIQLHIMREHDMYVLSMLHKRNAERLRDMCARNGGLYIKLGQHIAMLDNLVPFEYQDVLSSLLSATPQSSFDAVKRVVEADLGAPITSLYDRFDESPIASASLAQVHVAYKDGKKYAIKVQHEGLRESSSIDMYVITRIVSLVSYLFKDFNFDWLSREMNTNMPQELDFTIEQSNIKQCRQLFVRLIKQGDLAIPHVYDKLSSCRVITMSFEDGCYVSHEQRVRSMGLDKHDIAYKISKVFWMQIFDHGFLHCDPHPANLLVRQHPSQAGKCQLVLLDHGLYRHLDKDFRMDYCRLWQGLVLSDEAIIKDSCERMNSGPLYPLLAAMITQKPWDAIMSDDLNRMHLKADGSEAAMLRSYAKLYVKEIVSLLGSVPSELLLVFKTSDCLRHLDKILHSPVNTMTVAAEVVSNVLLNESWQRLWSDDESCSWEDALRQLSAELYRWWQVRSRLLYLWMYTAYVHYVNGKWGNILRTAVAA